jgi:hypothetical protein
LDQASVEQLSKAHYRVTTVVPLVDNPTKNVYVFDQEGMGQFLEGYEEHAEFVVDIRKIEDQQRGEEQVNSP